MKKALGAENGHRLSKADAEMAAALECAGKLNGIILGSQAYGNFLDAQDRLSEAPKYREMVDRFRKKQVSHEVRKLNGEDVSGEEFTLANEYADICLINVCNDFFMAEMELLELIKVVNEKVFEGVDVCELA